MADDPSVKVIEDRVTPLDIVLVIVAVVVVIVACVFGVAIGAGMVLRVFRWAAGF